MTPAETPIQTKRDQIANIIREVSIRHQVKAESILGRSKPYYVACARMEAMWRLRDELGLSMPEIGTIFSRHHTTVMHGLNMVSAFRAKGVPWPAKKAKPGIEFDPGHFDFCEKPKRKRKLKPAKPVEVIISAPCKAVEQAQSINTFWQRRGINANARAVRVGRRIVVKSDLELVGATA